jgi:hypothetical protein
MGFIRKVVSGTAASLTGGASLLVVQFRSDTERGTHQVKKLRDDLQRQSRPGGQETIFITGGSSGVSEVLPAADDSLGRVEGTAGTDALSLFSSGLKTQPDDLTPGWKPHPEHPTQDRFWNGSAWTSKVRATKS